MVLREDCVAELNNYIDPLYRSGFVGSHVFKQENLDRKLLTCILEVDAGPRVHTALCFRGKATSGSNQPALPLVITNPECVDFGLIRGLRPKSHFGMIFFHLEAFMFKFGTMHAGTVTYNITQYSGVRKLETVTVTEVNAYVLNSPLRRFTDSKGSAGQETQQERPEELSFRHGALS
ncbi:hypothetical protein IGI04_023620 [Brassica rapa subsp. trilocularis]|uniref:Uncharacterized protein n=1 Tax=Brassica rapa subsp. trilocularis TaxID=1813537 RepID=A0ABQ7M524_BRACM|nr:hypothetical protein IGI04_023620 [Brassica rapa subsp. trilocularis]